MRSLIVLLLHTLLARDVCCSIYGSDDAGFSEFARLIAQRVHDYNLAAPALAVYEIPGTKERALLAIDFSNNAFLFASTNRYCLRTRQGSIYEKSAGESEFKLVRQKLSGEFVRIDSVFDHFTPTFLEKYIEHNLLKASVSRESHGYRVEIPLGLQTQEQKYSIIVDFDDNAQALSYTESWTGNTHRYLFDDSLRNVFRFTSALYPDRTGYCLLKVSELTRTDNALDSPEAAMHLIEREVLKPVVSGRFRIVTNSSPSGSMVHDQSKSNRTKIVNPAFSAGDGYAGTIVIQNDESQGWSWGWVIVGIMLICIGLCIAIVRKRGT